MLEDEIRKVVADMLAAEKKPSVRTVREAVGRGSHTDIGDVLRRIQEEQERVKFAQREAPTALQDQATMLVGDLWRTAQEIANRAAEDIRAGCERRVAEALAQAKELMLAADESDAIIAGLKVKLEEVLSSHERSASKLEASQHKVISLEAEIRGLNQVAERREKELERAFRVLQRPHMPDSSDLLHDLSERAQAAVVTSPPIDATSNEEAHPSDHQVAATAQIDWSKLTAAAAELIKSVGRPLSSAEILEQLPDVEPTVTAQRLYKALWRRAGKELKNVGDGRFALADEPVES